MEKQVKCPWCGQSVVLVEEYFDNEYATVRERRCPRCNRLLSARLAEEKTQR